MATATSNSVDPLTDVNNNNGTLTEEFISGLVQGSSWVFAGPQGQRALHLLVTKKVRWMGLRFQSTDPRCRKGE